MKCCQPTGGGGKVSMPKIELPGGLPTVPGGGAAPTITQPTAPTLSPIKPTAEYDPEIAKALAAQRGYTERLESGTGHAQDVMLTGMNDQIEAQVAQARAAAEAANIPFDEGQYRALLQQGVNTGLAQEKIGREKMIGEAIGAASGVATQQAAERNARLGIDLSAQMGTGSQLLQRYGIDVSKYGTDIQAATAANNALLEFYARILTGQMQMFGSLGNQSFSETNYYA
jgi:hypothetical protein